MEKYDEVVFKNPPLRFQQCLIDYQKSSERAQREEVAPLGIMTRDLWSSFPSEAECIEKLTVAHRVILEQLTGNLISLHNTTVHCV